MKERPILFSGPMARAILDGKKTQTRRIARLPDSARGVVPEKIERGHVVRGGPPSPNDWVATYVGGGSGPGGTWQRHAIACPYGAPGDRLWVRETWALLTGAGIRCVYRADGEPRQRFYPDEPIPMKWAPSIHMPRKHSRLTLEVVKVRVERLQDISEADARAEGVQPDTEALSALSHLRGADAARAVPSRLRSSRDSFRDLWDGINGKRAPWASSPWVWVVEFRRAP